MKSLRRCASIPVLAVFFTSAAGYAYPLIIKIKDVPDLQYTRRNTLIVAVPSEGKLKRIPHSIDELEDDSLLVIRKPTKELSVREKLHHPKQRDPFQGSLQGVHRIVVDESEFTKCDDKCIAQIKPEAKRLCGMDDESRIEPYITRIDLTLKKTSGFIISCGKTVSDVFSPPVKLDTENRKFESDNLAITYKKTSPIVFENIAFEKNKNQVFNNSQLEVLVKPKLFLSIHFTEDDLKSEITSFQEQGAGTSAELAMKLKTFGITTSFEICCDISVYRDAFYFPVVVDLPFSGSSTRQGSGIFYGFNFLGDLKKGVQSELSGYKDIKKSEPVSSAVVVFKKGENAMAIGIRPSSQDKNYVKASLMTPSEAKDVGFDAKKSNIGVFMDITGIKSSGLQRFEVWFYGGKSSDIEVLKQYAQSGITYKYSQL